MGDTSNNPTDSIMNNPTSNIMNISANNSINIKCTMCGNVVNVADDKKTSNCEPGMCIVCDSCYKKIIRLITIVNTTVHCSFMRRHDDKNCIFCNRPRYYEDTTEMSDILCKEHFTYFAKNTINDKCVYCGDAFPHINHNVLCQDCNDCADNISTIKKNIRKHINECDNTGCQKHFELIDNYNEWMQKVLCRLKCDYSY